MSSSASSTQPKVKVLIVCLGNICRSPMGQAVLQDIAAKRGLDIEVDSAGTAAYHVGDDPDDRCVATCKKHHVPINHQGRQVSPSDFTKFTHILAADESNLRNILRIKPQSATADVRLWGSYMDGMPIPDPYYGGLNGFEKVFEQCTELSNAFLDQLSKSA